MLAARKLSGKLNTEMFDDVPVLQRKWHAALRPGEKLPRYEDVMLGSLGRLADHIVLLKDDNNVLEVSRAGRYVQKWLNDDRQDIPVNALSPDCATALGEAATCALANGGPHLAAAHCVRDGLVQTYDVLALPTSSRWGHTLVGVYVNERAPQYNLLDAIFSATDEGVLSLAAIRDSEGRPFDFQIVHHNQGPHGCSGCLRPVCCGTGSAQEEISCVRRRSSSDCLRWSGAATATSSKSTATIGT
jgi:hypothetical protein